MAEARSRPLVVTSPTGVPLGLISSADLCEAVAVGVPVSDVPAGELMNRRFRTAAPGLRTADYLLEMMRGRSRPLAVTEDGTPGSPLRTVLTDDDLAVDCGRNPVLLVTETLAAETVSDLASLSARAQALLTEGLVGPSTVAWLSEALGEVNAPSSSASFVSRRPSWRGPASPLPRSRPAGSPSAVRGAASF